MKKILLILPLLVVLQPRAISQTPAPANQPHELMHEIVQVDRIALSNGEFIPRFATYLPKSLFVGPKQTVTLPADSTYDAIEVAGTLRVDPSIDTVLRVTHLTVLPGGQLDWQVPCGKKLEVIFRDVPIDLNRDPFQWGNGLIVFGKQVRRGCAIPKTWIPVTGDLKAGDTAITLKEAPAGWQKGDALIIPDTKSPAIVHGQPTKIRREAPLTVAGIEGSTLTLSKPLDFDHPAVRDPQGKVWLTADVANFSRNIVLRSENPAGVPAHTVTIGHQASWEIRYNEFRGMGRTKVEPIQSTTVDRKVIGKNQVGRYADHYHHTQGLNGITQGNAYTGHPGSKWALVLHRTSDAVASWNVCVDTPGACFVTEDGDEVRTKFLDNFGAYSTGGPVDLTSPFSNITNPQASCPGCEGAVLWPRGLHQAVIERNHSWDSNFGLMIMPAVQAGAAARFPSQPGGSLDTPFPPSIAPASFTDNVTAGNILAGVDYWAATPFPVVRHISVNNSLAQVQAGPTNSGIVYRDPVILCDTMVQGFDVRKPYVSVLRVDGGMVAGCAFGLDGGGGNLETMFRNVTMQNRVNLMYPVTSLTDGNLVLDNVKYLPLGENPLVPLEYAQYKAWQPAGPGDDITVCRQYVKNWQGTGKNYCLSTPLPRPTHDPYNAARADNGAVATASSVFQTSDLFAPRAVNDGDRLGSEWGVLEPHAWGAVWMDAGAGGPDWVVIDFKTARKIDSITVISTQDNYHTPVRLTPELTCSLYCAFDYDVQAWTGSAWQTVPNGSIVGNDRVMRQVEFPPMTTSRIRVVVTRSGKGRHPEQAQLVEVEAHTPDAIGGPPPVDVNIPRLIDAKGHVFTLVNGQVLRDDIGVTAENVAKQIGLCEGSVYVTGDGSAWSKYVGPRYPAWEGGVFSCTLPGKHDEVCGNGIDDDGDGHVDENCRQSRR